MNYVLWGDFIHEGPSEFGGGTWEETLRNLKRMFPQKYQKALCDIQTNGFHRERDGTEWYITTEKLKGPVNE